MPNVQNALYRPLKRQPHRTGKSITLTKSHGNPVWPLSSATDGMYQYLNQHECGILDPVPNPALSIGQSAACAQRRARSLLGLLGSVWRDEVNSGSINTGYLQPLRPWTRPWTVDTPLDPTPRTPPNRLRLPAAVLVTLSSPSSHIPSPCLIPLSYLAGTCIVHDEYRPRLSRTANYPPVPV